MLLAVIPAPQRWGGEKPPAKRTVEMSWSSLSGEGHDWIWSQSHMEDRILETSSIIWPLYTMTPNANTDIQGIHILGFLEDPVNKVICQDIISFSSCDMIRCSLPVRLWKLTYLSFERWTANSMSVGELRFSWSVWNRGGYQSNLSSLWLVSGCRLSNLQERGWQGMNYGLIAFLWWAKFGKQSFGWALWIKKLWKSFSIVDR